MNTRNVNNPFMKIVKTFHLLVFQHLEGEELITLSEASAEIDKSVQTCPHCAYKLTVHLTIEKYNKLDDLKSIINSKRNYRNFKLTCGNQEDLSLLFLQILDIFNVSIFRLEVNGMVLPTNEHTLKLPFLKFLKVSSSNLNALNVLLGASERFQKLEIENFKEPVIERKFMEQLMRFRNIQLMNIDNIDMKAVKNLDFLFGGCIDFQLECNRKSDYTSLAKLFEIIRCRELRIRWMKPGTDGYRLTLHRLKRVEDIEIPTIELFARRTDQNINDPRYGDAKFLPPEYFLILLEISELSWSFMVKIGQALTECHSLNIFELSDREKRNFFLTFKSLETITTISGSHGDMETETTTKRSSIQPRPIKKDPLFKLSTETLELVFQHFTYEDFHYATQVSASWNNLMSKSSMYMRLIKLSLSKLKPGNSHDIVRSLKHFENIEICGNNKPTVVPDIIRILQHFSNFIMDLYLYEVKVKRVKPFYMPNLKVLVMHSCSDNLPGAIMDNCMSLTYLKFQNMPIYEKYLYRISNQKKLQKLFFIDCEGDKIKHINYRKKIELYDMNHIEVSLWKPILFKNTSHSVGFEELIVNNPCLAAVPNLVINGFLMPIAHRVLRGMTNLRKFQFGNFFASEIINHDKILHPIDIYCPNINYIGTVYWRHKFPKHRRMYAGETIEPIDYRFDASQRKFLKAMKLSGRKMIENNIFVSEDGIPGINDPMMRIPPDLHDLVFQHFDYPDVLGMFEVSRTWNIMGKESKLMLSKVRLKLPMTHGNQDKAVVNQCSPNHQNILMYSYGFSYVQRFSESVRELSIISSTSEIRVKPEDYSFENVEYLNIRRELLKGGAQTNVLNLLTFFKKCRKIKTFTCTEKIDKDSVGALFDILRNNKDLKILKLELISDNAQLFSQDFTTGMDFKLEKLMLGFHDFDLFKINNVDSKLLSFLQLHRDTCEELRISYCSKEMFTEVVSNYKKCHTFYTSNGFSSIEANDLPVNLTITHLVLPASLNVSPIPKIIEKLPSIENIHIPRINSACIEAFNRYALNVKNVSFHKELDQCLRSYHMANPNFNLSSPKVYYFRIETVRFEDMTIEHLFSPKSPYRAESPGLRRGYGRYGRDYYDDEDEDEDEEEEEYGRYRRYR